MAANNASINKVNVSVRHCINFAKNLQVRATSMLQEFWDMKYGIVLPQNSYALNPIRSERENLYE